jgi:hypothetical protein
MRKVQHPAARRAAPARSSKPAKPVKSAKAKPVEEAPRPVHVPTLPFVPPPVPDVFQQSSPPSPTQASPETDWAHSVAAPKVPDPDTWREGVIYSGSGIVVDGIPGGKVMLQNGKFFAYDLGLALISKEGTPDWDNWRPVTRTGSTEFKT